MHRHLPIASRQSKRHVLMISAAVLLVAVCLGASANDGNESFIFASTGKHRKYMTNFGLTENPISERGKWISGRGVGLDWADVRTLQGFAFGTQTATVTTAPGQYDDSTALVAGPWDPDQAAEATVRTRNPHPKAYEEVELRLRSTLTPHRATGYEITFRCLKSPKSYCDIVRWNGPLGSFTYVKQGRGSQFGVGTGDVVKATIRGSVITAYINGVQVLQGTDSTFQSGSPGIGFYVENAPGSVDGDYGFTSFTAGEE